MKKLILVLTAVLSGVIYMAVGVSTAKDSIMIDEKHIAKATFAGGCFWCMEPPFDALDGVLSTTSGYAGGLETNPTYDQVSSGMTGHLEVIQISYDTRKVDYAKLLEVYWQQINPTTPNQQFVDVGPMYRSAIFFHDDEQRKLAEQTKVEIGSSGIFNGPIVTEVLPLDNSFYPAEDYHQDYYQRNPIRYKYYRHHSGRDQFLEKIWGDNT